MCVRACHPVTLWLYGAIGCSVFVCARERESARRGKEAVSDGRRASRFRPFLRSRQLASYWAGRDEPPPCPFQKAAAARCSLSCGFAHVTQMGYCAWAPLRLMSYFLFYFCFAGYLGPGWQEFAQSKESTGKEGGGHILQAFGFGGEGLTIGVVLILWRERGKKNTSRSPSFD